MGEYLKAVPSVIHANSTIPNAAKRQILICILRKGVVDATASKFYVTDYKSLKILRFRKYITGQGVAGFSNYTNNFIIISESINW